MKYLICAIFALLLCGVAFAGDNPFEVTSDPFVDAAKLPANGCACSVGKCDCCVSCKCGGKVQHNQKKAVPKKKAAAKRMVTVCGPNGCVRIPAGQTYQGGCSSGSCGSGGCSSGGCSSGNCGGGRVRIFGGRFRR